MKQNQTARARVKVSDRIPSLVRKCGLSFLAVVWCLAFSGCEYDIPITAKPTRKVEERLLGNWTSKDGSEKLKVRRWDDSNYLVLYNGDPMRVCHSDVAGTALVSVQELESAKRKYAYLTWRLMDGGQRLGLRVINQKLIPFETRSSRDVQRLLKANLQRPDLFEEEAVFTHEKDGK